MQVPTRTKIDPIVVPRTLRPHETRVLTSFAPGKCAPIAAIPLLREDAVRSGSFRFSFELMETAEILLNAVEVRVKAYLVPNLAFDRFDGIDHLNRSYEGVEYPSGSGTVTPYIETETAVAGTHEIYNTLGMHARDGESINTAYREAYNQIFNFRAANRSPDIAPRDLTDTTLAPAFWVHSNFKHIVPDFDQALVDGQAILAYDPDNSRLNVMGIGPRIAGGTNAGPEDILQADGTTLSAAGAYKGQDNNSVLLAAADATAGALPEIYVELAQAGISMSLSNIDLARKTAAFARLRTQYHGHTDDWIIDMLMDGIHIPEQEMRQPILIGQQETVFGMSKRYATDHANMTESVVNGATFIDMRVAVPRLNTGGVIMFIAEVTPEQLFERQRDPYFNAQGVDDLPQFLRDHLDPEKVSVVPNDHVDIDHDTPKDVFGYAPLNYEWIRKAPNIGGKFIRPSVDAGFDEDRQRLWSVETQNPTLSTDFYLCTNMHEKPFVFQDIDQVEVVLQGGCQIEGNTVFGPALIESTDDYEKVADEAPTKRIDKSATTLAAATAAAPDGSATNAAGTDEVRTHGS